MCWKSSRWRHHCESVVSHQGLTCGLDSWVAQRPLDCVRRGDHLVGAVQQCLQLSCKRVGVIRHSWQCQGPWAELVEYITVLGAIAPLDYVELVAYLVHRQPAVDGGELFQV